MNSRKEVAVVIPCYKEKLNELETISLNQVKKILGRYHMYMVLPERLEDIDVFGLKKVFFNDQYFENIKTYNRLMLSQEFYQRFEEYRYILIYQLDAFVFTDRLMEFCQKGYDYIGAPWLAGEIYYFDCKNIIWHVGNGGFSLRNVKSCKRLINENREFLKDYKRNEDLFFGMGLNSDFSVAPINVALDFSIESDVRCCFKMNNNNISFGCHAWEKYDFEFWREYIEGQGYHVDDRLVKKGNKDYQEICRKKRLAERNNFFEKEYTSQLLKNVLTEILYKSDTSAISIWGAGFWCDIWIKMLTDSGYHIKNIYDANETLHNTKLHSFMIKPLELMEKDTDTLVLVSACISEGDVKEEIIKRGFKRPIQYILGTEVLSRMQQYELTR